MTKPNLISAIATIAAMTLACTAQAGSTFYFNANQSYLSSNDSPFSSTSGMKIETFEDGLLNVNGLSATAGKVKGPGSKTDSVDGDDGNINGKGKNGHSFSSGSDKKITFKFTNSGQNMPTMAGLVWTDGKHNSTVKFKAWDSNGDLIGKIKVKLGDLSKSGTTSEDRFFGLVSDKGISKIQLVSNYSGFEIDHVQFAYGLAVVPVPAPLALGLAGLAGAAVWRRRMLRKAA